jgi:hypothetical protein
LGEGERGFRGVFLVGELVNQEFRIGETESRGMGEWDMKKVPSVCGLG